MHKFIVFKRNWPHENWKYLQTESWSLFLIHRWMFSDSELQVVEPGIITLIKLILTLKQARMVETLKTKQCMNFFREIRFQSIKDISKRWICLILFTHELNLPYSPPNLFLPSSCDLNDPLSHICITMYLVQQNSCS